VAEPESSWISTFIGNPLYIGGVVAALLLSGLLWMMMVGSRRRKGLTKFEDSIMTGGEFKNNAVFNVPPTSGATGVAKAAPTEGSMLLTDFSRMGMGGIDSHEVDPIAEAEVYMAYGRDAQAEEILKEALGKDPSRHEIALKLLEIYAARKDIQQFETTASELYASLGGQNTPVWQRAAEMGRSIDPDNPLYRAASTVSAATAAMAGAAASAVLARTAEAPEPVLETITHLEADAGFAAPTPAPAMADNVLEFTPSLDTGWGDETLTTTLPEAMPEPTPEAPGPEGIPDEFAALGLDLEVAPQVAEVPEPAMEVAETPFDAMPTAATPEAAEELESLEISAPPLEFEPLAGEAETPAVPELDFSGIDLDLAVEPIPEVSEIELSEVQELEAPAMEASALDFEMPADLEMVAIEPLPESVPELAPAESGIDPVLREEVNTKLDLAKAYLEMGDREGAREILQEVMTEGDSGQKAEANKLLAEAG
jgi:pilus assembly protein FimV